MPICLGLRILNDIKVRRAWSVANQSQPLEVRSMPMKRGAVTKKVPGIN